MKTELIFSETEKEIISRSRKAIYDLTKEYADKINRPIGDFDRDRLERQYYALIEPYEKAMCDVYKFHCGKLKVTFENEEERKQFEKWRTDYAERKYLPRE